MERTFLSRQYLESVSTADLLSLADDYGIDIPDDLNRRFIIAELLEAADEMEAAENVDKDVTITDGGFELPEALPDSYNETQIHAVLRNPAWAFVFWDIHQGEFETLERTEGFGGLYLHVAFFDSATTEKTTDFFDIAVTPRNREQYILIPAGKRSVGIELKCDTCAGPQLLASTGRLEIPCGCTEISSLQPGKEVAMSPLARLSGLEGLLRDRYREHRQSFS